MDIVTIASIAILYGVTMKIADLLNEHGMKWFRFSDVLFGILCGAFGALLLFSDAAVSNIILAMVIAFVIRRRIDYLNHAIAFTIIIVTFLIYGSVNPALFLPFFLIFTIFGGLKDYVDDVLKKRNGLLFALNESMLYYPIPTFVYSLLYGNWIVFVVFLLYTISYDATKYYAAKRSYK